MLLYTPTFLYEAAEVVDHHIQFLIYHMRMWQTEIFIKQHIFETVNSIGDLPNKDLYWLQDKVEGNIFRKSPLGVWVLWKTVLSNQTQLE